MDKIKSIAFVLLIAAGINYFSYYIGSNFISKYPACDMITLLLMVFTVNVATTNFIISKINELKLHTKIPFKKSLSSLKWLMIEQITLILIAVVVLILRESPAYEKPFLNFPAKHTIDTLLIFVIIYYISILWDMGRSMFLISNFNPNEK